MSKDSFHVAAYYKFILVPEAELEKICALLDKKGKELNLGGLIILGVEGINSTVAGNAEAIQVFKEYLTTFRSEFSDLEFKDSLCSFQPFKRFKVEIKPEIVTYTGDLNPIGLQHNHLSPTEWDKVLKEEKDFVVIDVRNDYEYELGHFKRAINPDTDTFGEFADFVKQSDIPHDKKVLMYCTGGIRCEKALIDMERAGYKNVFQLEGGILKYLEELPNQEFKGECFVFDNRVAVDQHLQESKQYRLCPHCGNPGKVPVSCVRCGKDSVVCWRCEPHEDLRTCSKDCTYHFRLGHTKSKNNGTAAAST